MKIKVLYLVVLFFMGFSVCYGATDTAILNFVNSPTTTATILQSKVGLTVLQSTNIIAKRPFTLKSQLITLTSATAVTKISSYIDKLAVVPVVNKVVYIKDKKGRVIGVIKYK